MKDSRIFKWSRAHPLLAVVVLLACADLLIAYALAVHHHAHLRVTFLDIGQGDAVFIEAPNGVQLLYDAGPPSGAVLRELARVMSPFDRTIDVAVFSHPDMDHIGGFPEVFKRYEIDAAVESGAHSDNGVYDATEVAIKDEHSGHIIAKEGMRIDLGAGVYADILYPDHDTSTMETNSASIVMNLHYGSTSFLFSGDLPEQIEDYLVGTEAAYLSANVLKLGHHGSRTSSGVAWLTAVHPDIAVISCGKNNRYGHPHQETLARLKELGIPFLRTDEVGAITFESDGLQVTRI